MSDSLQGGCAPVGGAARAWRVVAVRLVARHVVGTAVDEDGERAGARHGVGEVVP